MKKGKILIPSLLTTVVLPLVTSCGKSGDVEGNYKTDGLYESKVKNAKSDTPLTPPAATQRYFDDLSKNHMIFWNDFLLNSNFSYQSMIQMGVQVNEYSVKLSIDKVDATNHTLSVKFYSMTDLVMESPYLNQQIHIVAVSDFVLENIEWSMRAIYDVSENIYGDVHMPAARCSSLNELLNVLDKQKTGSIKGKAGSATGDEQLQWQNFDFNQSKKPSTSEDESIIRWALEMEFASTYLSDIKYDPNI